MLNGIYAAVRDRDWNTIEPVLRQLKIRQDPESFEVTFHAACEREGIRFQWWGTITGENDGTIRYHFRGHARSAFLRNRIGFCVLHDAGCAGRSCRVTHADGRVVESVFPEAISPHQPFKNLRSIRHPIRHGLELEVLMEGDVFEMEDQRNWTDASFKTYCTPLEMPFPVEIRAGEVIEQTVTVTLHGDSAEQGGAPAADTAVLESSDSEFIPMPRLGLGIASHPVPLSEREISRLRTLNLDHLRVDVTPLDGAWRETLNDAQEQARLLDARLHVAVHLDDRGEDQLKAIQEQSGDQVRVDVWLIFHRDEKATSSRWTARARTILGSGGGLIVGGTDAYFAELNRHRPERGSADGFSWSINPQVHAFDNLSLVETLDCQWETVISAGGFLDGELMISPVTLLPRFNPNATRAPEPVPQDQLPREVDARQMSLFGAAWTLGTIASLARGQRLRSVTLFETTGWRGLMETSAGPRLVHRFVSRPNMVFPMYFVFALLAGHGFVRPLRVHDRLRATGLLVKRSADDPRVRLLLASFHSQETTVALPPGFEPDRQLVLEQTIAVNMCRSPESFLCDGWSAPSGNIVKMGPFALMALDGTMP